MRGAAVREIGLKEIQAIELEILECIAGICEKHGLRYYLVGGTLLGAVRHGGFIPWDDDIDISMPREDFDRLKELCKTELPLHYRYVDYKVDWRIPYHSAKVIDTRTIVVEDVRRADYQVELGLFVDIFPLDGVPRGRIRWILHYGQIAILRKLLTTNAAAQRSDRSVIKGIVIRLVQAVLGERAVKRLHARLDRLMRRYRVDESEELCNYAGAWGVRERFPREWLGERQALEFEGRRFRVVRDYDAYLRHIYGDYMTPPPPERRRSHHRQRAFWR